jgi:hypothetical protein
VSFRNEVDQHLGRDDPDIAGALRLLASAVDTLWSDRAKAERLQQLAEQSFTEGLQQAREGR